MKTAKKYYNEKDIIKEIDAAKAKKEREAKHAEELDKFADECFAWINAHPADQRKQTDQYKQKYHAGGMARRAAARLRKHQSSFEPKLLRLKRTLAAFNTEPFTFCERAVIAQ